MSMAFSSKNRCVFCNIVSSSDSGATVRLELIIIDDHRPRAKYHFQCIPRKHIKNIFSLNPNDLALVLDMAQMAQKLLEELNKDMKEFKIGFHRPPYNSVQHLHLHIIGPSDKITEKHMFRPPIFVPVESVLDYLQKQNKQTESEKKNSYFKTYRQFD